MASRSRRKAERRRSSPWKRRFKLALALGFIAFLAVFCILSGLFLYKVKEAEAKMPTLEDKFAEVNRQPTRILTADGVEIYRLSPVNRIPLKLSQIPVMVRNAIIAAEDKRFYQHDGVDAQGLGRAFWSVFREGRVSQGGSTITMQLAKRLYNGNDRTFARKMDDIAYAYEIERYLGSKNRILELYLNQVYFGETAHGIGAAAKVYFNKDVQDLTISDAAILARCVRLPSKENPIKNLKVAMENRDVVLSIMRDEHMITPEQYEDALAEKPKINPHPPSTTAYYSSGYAQYVVNHVLDIIDKSGLNIDIKAGGYTIYTTVDSKLQQIAEKSVHDRVNEFRKYKVNQGMCLAMDTEGRILCEAGGVDFEKSQYNIVEKGSLQPGSGFKPFLYSIALRDGVIGPNDYLSNAPITIRKKGQKPWTPVNSSRSEDARGSYSVTEAISRSINRPAVWTIMKLKPETLVQAAHTVFGFRSKLAPYEPLALGASDVNPQEMAEGYSVFMLRGDRVRPFLVSKIIGPEGEVVHETFPNKTPGVLDASICDQMNYYLRHVVTGGTGMAAQVIDRAVGKTGTTNDAKDAWFNGFSDGVLCIAWVGNEQLIKGQWTQLSMASNVYGGTTAIHIWCDVMKVAQKKFGHPPPDDQNSQTTAPIMAPRKHEETPPVVPPSTEPDGIPPDFPPGEEDPAMTGGTTGDPTTPPDDQKGGHVNPPTDTLGGKPPVDPPGTGNEDVDNPKPKTTDTKGPRTSDDNQTVTVEVCADSGLIATRYCPETVTRTFSKRSAPKEHCKIHRPGG